MNPTVALERILDTLEIPHGAAPQVLAIRRIVSHSCRLADTYHDVLEELRELQAMQPNDRVRNLTHQVQTLTQSLANNRARSGRLERLLMSVAGNHPHSGTLWNDIFLFLGLDQDMDLKNRLLNQMITARPRNMLPPPDSPNLNQDDSVRGVYLRGHVRTGRNAPNSV